MEQEYIGVIEDPRSDFEKSKDYKHEDLVRGKAIVNWQAKTDEQLKKYTIRNQDGSSACCAFASAKILGMHEVKEGKTFANLSPKFIYTRRFNYPDGGMFLPNALDILCKHGACLETTMPCDMQNEMFMNNKTTLGIDEALKYKARYYFEVKRDMDTIAEILEQGYGLLLGARFDYDEWLETPIVKPKSTLKCGHGIAIVDYLIKDGKKVLMIEDSWGVGTGKGGRRFITEEFLLARCFYVGYVTSLDGMIFTQTLRVGSRGVEVRALQEKLGIPADGIFGNQTKQAVIKFQKENGLSADGIVGKNTRACLNK